MNTNSLKVGRIKIMPLLNYKKQFAPMVLDGSKRQTIRARRKDGKDPKPGDTLYNRTGLRTKKCVHLNEPTCKSVEEISISPTGSLITIDEVLLSLAEMEHLAWDNGFRSLNPAWEMINFFENVLGLPFSGLLIKW
jgi:hypothetical protein